MAASREFLDFLAEQMAGFGPVSMKRMFSGAGVFRNDLMFALVIGDTLYFKTHAADRAGLAAEGLGPFTYMKKDGEHTLTSYWRAPERCLDDPDEMVAACRRAYAAAVEKASKKPASSRKAAAPRR